MSPILNELLNAKSYTFTNVLMFILIIISNVEALRTKKFWALWMLWAFMGPHTTNIPLVCVCTVGIGIGLGSLFTISESLTALIFGFKEFEMIFELLYTGYGIIGSIVEPYVSGLVLKKN
ncbi:hypothetical protein BCR32DRAFT_282237 [Anaeromyces robustus]|uniref:Uncharacterized protein n=1 Tax=Anaeromyces robustus TaxID=1754192 RepID=A0A1Y1WY59_9FUNG|nr:hypothetical protein BCR32DRAFT_282237 [Anaeromyces robustus]|eukprot:ORX78490.1 hypothetical protein BCR32DRAFT_282237 [Anaeromyces robustus]